MGKLKINHLCRASIWCWESCSPGRSRKWRTLGYETTSCDCYCTWWYYPSFEITIYLCHLSCPNDFNLVENILERKKRNSNVKEIFFILYIKKLYLKLELVYPKDFAILKHFDKTKKVLDVITTNLVFTNLKCCKVLFNRELVSTVLKVVWVTFWNRCILSNKE